MISNNKQAAARRFVETWKGRGYEKGETQSFWYQLLHDIFGVEIPANFIQFELPVHLKSTKFIDAYILSTKVIIEQKELKKDLDTAGKQSDGKKLTPYEQAQRYIGGLNYTMWPRWIVTCNFKSFKVYDMEQPQAEPMEILLENLEREYYLLKFLVDDNTTSLRREKELSVKAGELIGKLYNELHQQYHDPDTPQALHSLNVLCIRLVFCLFAEKSLLFGDNRSAFHDYLMAYKPSQMRTAIQNLFDVLDTEERERDPYMEESLSRFPYVNGGLFSKEEKIEIPQFTESIANLLLNECSAGFDWSGISTIMTEDYLKDYKKHLELPRLLFYHYNLKNDMRKKESELKRILIEYNHLLVSCVNRIEWFIQKSESLLCAKREFTGKYGMCYFLRLKAGREQLEEKLEGILPYPLSAECQVDNIIKSLNHNFDMHVCALIDREQFDNLIERFFRSGLTVEDIVAYMENWGESPVKEAPSFMNGEAPNYYSLLEDFYSKLSNPYRRNTILGESFVACMLKDALEVIVRNQVKREFEKAV